MRIRAKLTDLGRPLATPKNVPVAHLAGHVTPGAAHSQQAASILMEINKHQADRISVTSSVSFSLKMSPCLSTCPTHWLGMSASFRRQLSD